MLFINVSKKTELIACDNIDASTDYSFIQTQIPTNGYTQASRPYRFVFSSLLSIENLLRARPSEASSDPFVPFTRRKMYVLRLKLVHLESCPILTTFWHICRKFVWPTEATNNVFLVSPTYDDDTNPKLENPVKHFTGCHLGHKDEIIRLLTDHTCFGYCALFDTHFFATFSTTTTFMVD